MHAHVAAEGPVGGALEDYLGHGIVGIRDMGGRADELLALRAAVASGERLGPIRSGTSPKFAVFTPCFFGDVYSTRRSLPG
jgi:hypothetical protein